MILNILITFSISFLGILVYVGIMIYNNVRKDKKLDLSKLFGENKVFWIVTIILSLVLCITVNVLPEAKTIVGAFANLDSPFGYFGMGYVLAQGTDITPTFKKLNDKISSDDGKEQK